MSAESKAPEEDAATAPELASASAIVPDRVMVLTEAEQRLIVHTLTTKVYEDPAAGPLVARVEHGDSYQSAVDEIVRVTLRKRRLEQEIRHCNKRIAALEPEIIEGWTQEGTTGAKHAATGATLRRDDKLWVKVDVDTDGLPKTEADALKAQVKAEAGGAMMREDVGLGHFVRPDWNGHSVSAYFRELYRWQIAEQADLPEHERTPIDTDGLLPEPLRGLLRIDTTPHIQVRAS